MLDRAIDSLRPQNCHLHNEHNDVYKTGTLRRVFLVLFANFDAHFSIFRVTLLPNGCFM